MPFCPTFDRDGRPGTFAESLDFRQMLHPMHSLMAADLVD
jgi:hypothetical protein